MSTDFEKLEELKQAVLASYLETAREAIVSDDPFKAAKGRFTRDAAVPIMGWFLSEMQRIYGPLSLVGGEKTDEHRRLKAETIDVLVQGIAVTIGTCLRPLIEPGRKSITAAVAVTQALGRQLLDEMRQPAAGGERHE